MNWNIDSGAHQRSQFAPLNLGSSKIASTPWVVKGEQITKMYLAKMSQTSEAAIKSPLDLLRNRCRVLSAEPRGAPSISTENSGKILAQMAMTQTLAMPRFPRLHQEGAKMNEGTFPLPKGYSPWPATQPMSPPQSGRVVTDRPVSGELIQESRMVGGTPIAMGQTRERNPAGQLPAESRGPSQSAMPRPLASGETRFAKSPTSAPPTRVAPSQPRAPLAPLAAPISPPLRSQPQDVRSAPSAQMGGNVGRIRQELEVEKFTGAAIESLIAAQRAKLADIEKRGDLKAAKRELGLAKVEREMLQVMLEEMKAQKFDRGEVDQHAFKFYYTKFADAQALWTRLNK